jgi:UDP-N-acetylmuramoylalanine--D-glutamate ligase
VKSILAAYIHDHGYVKDEWKIQEIIQEIPPLDHRLRLLKIIGDIKIYDDGICTSSQALHAALTSFDEKVLLICGWYDKWDNYQWLSEFFGQKVWYCVAMWQTADTFADLCEKNTIPYKILPTLHEVIQTAYQKAKENNIKTILFSPGAASFDMFKNVYDRAEQFLAEVDQL